MKYIDCTNSENHSELLDSILSNSISYAIIATDLSNSIILWNTSAEILYGYSPEEVIRNKTPMDIHEINGSYALSLDNDIFRTNITNYEVIAIKKDGTKVPVLLTVTPRLDHSGCTIGYLLFTRNKRNIRIHEKFKNILMEISYALNMTSTINELCQSAVNVISACLDISHVFICTFNFLNNCFFINAQTGLCSDSCPHNCEYITQYSGVPKAVSSCFLTYSNRTINSDRLSNHVISDCVEDQDFKNDDASIIHIPLIYDISLLGILHIIVPSAQKNFFLYEAQILTLIANSISTGMQRVRLIEEIKQYADTLEKMVEIRTEQLREKDAQLVQSGKLATLGEMATGIAHEINQPLGSINLIAQGLIMAKERNRLTDHIFSEKLSSIIEQVERINKLITHLRTFARQSDNSKQEVDVNKPLTDTFKLIGQQLRSKNIKVTTSLCRDLPCIMADHNKLEQVFLNIIGNAGYALDEFEGKVKELKLSSDKPEWVDTWVKEINIRTYEDYGYVIIEIADNGGGIPEPVINKIFEPFFTTKEVGKGTGLGLSITYGIVKEFEGTIDVESKEQKGTRFIIKFPVCIK